MPILTICITTYNRWETCGDALLGVCRQTLNNIEIILVDDASADKIPVELSKLISDNNVTYIRHDKNKGLAAARNTAINIATGKYFSFCDDDDVWPNNFAERLVNSIEKVGNEVGMSMVLSALVKPQCQRFFDSNPKLSDVIREGFTPPVGSQIYITKMLREIGGYNPDIKSGVDHDLWISLANIDPNVSVDWGETVTVGRDVTVDRITSVEHRRRKLIAESLRIWKPQIIEVFGEKFYKHFCFSYKQYLDFNFFVQSMQKRDYIKASMRLFNYTVLSRLVSLLIYKAKNRYRGNLFPAYRKS